jgi:hypothetical protein
MNNSLIGFLKEGDKFTLKHSVDVSFISQPRRGLVRIESGTEFTYLDFHEGVGAKNFEGNNNNLISVSFLYNGKLVEAYMKERSIDDIKGGKNKSRKSSKRGSRRTKSQRRLKK